MFCTKCGNQLPDDARFCNKCGGSVSLSDVTVAASIPDDVFTRAPSPPSMNPGPIQNAPAVEPAKAYKAAPNAVLADGAGAGGLSKPVKTAIIAASAVIVLTLVILLIVNITRGSGTPSFSGNTRTASDSGSGSSRQDSGPGSNSSRQDSGGTSTRSSSRDDYDEDGFYGASGGRGGTSPNFTLARDSIIFYSTYNDVKVVANNNPVFSITGDMYTGQTSMDGSKAAVLMNYNRYDGGELWFVTTTDCYKVADYAVAFMLSDSGDGVAYITDYDDWDQTATLILYDTTSKTSTTVARDAFYNGSSIMPGVCVSPNGKSIGYITDYDEWNQEFSGYVKTDGGAAEKLGNNATALAISDGARYVYYAKIIEDDYYSVSLNVKSARSDIALISNHYVSEGLILNRDYSELIYMNEGNAFISRNGNEGQKVSGARIYDFIMPRWTQRLFRGSIIGNITCLGVGSFSDVVAHTENGLAYINGRQEMTLIPESSYFTSNAFISNDGRTLLYRDDSMRLIATDPARDSAGSRVVSEDVQTFTATNDARYVYYVNERNELWCVRDNRDPEKISDDVSLNRDHMAMSYNSGLLFFLVGYVNNRGGELYCTDNGGRREKVPGADEATGIYSTPASVFYINNDDECYRSSGNTDFTLLVRDFRY